jgi:hypothetical protein
MINFKNILSKITLPKVNFKGLWKNHKKNIIIIVLALLLLFVLRSYLKEIGNNKNYKELIKTQNQTVKQYKDENGSLHSQIKIFQTRKENMELFYGKQIDSLAAILNIKQKQLTDVLIIAKKTDGKFKVKIDTIIVKRTDTVVEGSDFDFTFALDTTYNVEYADKWIDFRGKYSTVEEKFTGEYKTYDSLTFVTFYKRKGFLNLGKKEWYLDVSSANPNSVITNVKNFKIVDERVKRIGIGPYIGVSVGDNLKLKPQVGVGLHYSLIRL